MDIKQQDDDILVSGRQMPQVDYVEDEKDTDLQQMTEKNEGESLLKQKWKPMQLDMGKGQ